jgi:hypothetical protein
MSIKGCNSHFSRSNDLNFNHRQIKKVVEDTLFFKINNFLRFKIYKKNILYKYDTILLIWKLIMGACKQ